MSSLKDKLLLIFIASTIALIVLNKINTNSYFTKKFGWFYVFFILFMGAFIVLAIIFKIVKYRANIDLKKTFIKFFSLIIFFSTIISYLKGNFKLKDIIEYSILTSFIISFSDLEFFKESK